MNSKEDGGGPLLTLRNGRFFQLGITSGGAHCDKEENLGIYTKVEPFIDWIEDVIRLKLKQSSNFLNSIFYFFKFIQKKKQLNF